MLSHLSSVGVHGYVWVGAHVHMYEAKEKLGCCSSGAIHLVSETVSHWLKLVKCGLGSQADACLCPSQPPSPPAALILQVCTTPPGS